jgi:hypothetical protein
MALTDQPDRKNSRYKRRAINAGNGVPWSDSQKLEAVQTYLMLGSVRMTSAALKIPVITIQVWRASTWWKDLESELKIQDELQLSTRLKKIAERSFAAVEDRLEHGNFVFDQKTGSIRRIPVPLKDAHKVAMETIQQQDLIASKHVEKANDGQILDKLEQLATKFAEMASDKFKQINDETRTVDMVEEVTDALYDEREEGLQEGESAVQFAAEREEETK